MTTNDDMRADFARIGAAQVRLDLANSRYNEHRKAIAIEWLAPIDAADSRRDEALQADKIQIARSAKDANWVSAKAALGATVIALIALAVSIFALLHGKLNAQ
jgi:hypothetical protein